MAFGGYLGTLLVNARNKAATAQRAASFKVNRALAFCVAHLSVIGYHLIADLRQYVPKLTAMQDHDTTAL